jgi:hypothetical protein
LVFLQKPNCAPFLNFSFLISTLVFEIKLKKLRTRHFFFNEKEPNSMNFLTNEILLEKGNERISLKIVMKAHLLRRSLHECRVISFFVSPDFFQQPLF